MSSELVNVGGNYKHAAAQVLDYISGQRLQFSTPEEDIQKVYSDFQERFSPERLGALTDEDILQSMFLTAGSENNSLCYYLEFNPQIKSFFGSISGGSSFKFGLFQRQEDGKWVTGSPSKPEILSDSDALELGKKIRDSLIAGCEYIQTHSFASPKDYEALDDALNSLMDKYASYAWIQKYFQMIFPDKFVGWYATGWQNHLLYSFGIEPSEKYYGKNGQLAIIKNLTGLNTTYFQEICWKLFGDIKHFYRLGSSDGTTNYADQWKTRGLVGVGWNELGDLLEFTKNGAIDKEKLTAKLIELYYQNDNKTASRKAGEIKSFYEAAQSSVFVVMDGDRLIGFVDNPSPYYYDDSEPMKHCRRGTWLLKFDESDSLPEQEGKLTTCYEIKKAPNLMFLYGKYYERQTGSEAVEELPSDDAPRVIVDEKDRLPGGDNILLYGVPGSGKSWTIEHEYCRDESAVERLVFHPDYTNADFIGQILPVVDKDKQVTYEFTPGPFTTIIDDAYHHPKEEFILVIEEINRGNAPAIFGEVFQLLDRLIEDKTIDGVLYRAGTSEYGVTHKYMAEHIYGDPRRKVRIPSNLSIIGTMNTSDQNVFTLDTAFQRRWRMRLIENNFDNVRLSLANAQILDTEVTWKRFCETVNGLIVGNRAKMASAEDKRLGVYFVHEKDLTFDSRALPAGDFPTLLVEYNGLLGAERLGTITDEQKIRLKDIRAALIHNRQFPEKVIKYLWDDAFKFNPEVLFDTGEGRMDSLETVIRTFVYSRGHDRFNIFKDTVRQKLYE